jgi:hypothetical protein
MEVENTKTTEKSDDIYNNSDNFVINPMVFIIIFLIIVACYVFSSSSGGDNLGGNDSSNGWGIFGTIIILILVGFILVNVLQYFFDINISTYFEEPSTVKTDVDIVIESPNYEPTKASESKFKKQVFNIPGNYYSYDNAKALCSAYGAELASYDQLEKAYNNGAEWCNYGWSANQLALFPTQKNTYDTLQTIPGHEHDCGRTGINGGYIANPEVKFGVNCYGYKPNMNSKEDELMRTSPPYPETAEDIAFQKKVDEMKNNLDKILVSPFNKTSWDEI